MTLPRILIGGLAAVVIVIVAAGAGWWFFIREDNKLATNAPAIPADLVKTPSASNTAASSGTVKSTTPAASTTTSSSGTNVFKILPDRSDASYFVGETLASLGLPSTAKGTTKDISGQFALSVDGFDLDLSTETKFTVNLKTLTSDKSMRDAKVQNQGLETSKYPTATFKATKLTGYDKSLAADAEQTLHLTGTMDLHGVQKEITWTVKARRAGNVITGLATVNFKFADFNIEQLNIGGFVSIEENVTLQVQIVAQAG